MWPVLVAAVLVTTSVSLFMNGALEEAAAAADAKTQTALVTLAGMIGLTLLGAVATVTPFRTLLGRGETAYRFDGDAVR